ncbi:MAG: hypothetical protein KDK36_06815 [Leptospiraceae bacterium]|nr:hypothetical protein [Leptospiraceae bacterium]
MKDKIIYKTASRYSEILVVTKENTKPEKYKKLYELLIKNKGSVKIKNTFYSFEKNDCKEFLISLLKQREKILLEDLSKTRKLIKNLNINNKKKSDNYKIRDDSNF